MAGEREIPPQIQNQLQKLQEMQRQFQVLATQRQQLDLNGRELERTLEELGKLGDDATLYKSAGSLLLKVKDAAAVKVELTDAKESNDVRLARVKKEEERLKERLTALQKELQAALGG